MSEYKLCISLSRSAQLRPVPVSEASPSSARRRFQLYNVISIVNVWTRLRVTRNLKYPDILSAPIALFHFDKEEILISLTKFELFIKHQNLGSQIPYSFRVTNHLKIVTTIF